VQNLSAGKIATHQRNVGEDPRRLLTLVLYAYWEVVFIRLPYRCFFGLDLWSAGETRVLDSGLEALYLVLSHPAKPRPNSAFQGSKLASCDRAITDGTVVKTRSRRLTVGPLQYTGEVVFIRLPYRCFAPDSRRPVKHGLRHGSKPCTLDSELHPAFRLIQFFSELHLVHFIPNLNEQKSSHAWARLTHPTQQK
ncbi:hypothetical protein HAX54_029853, partial [Datura stramonium]|nr:hypothetical protein [Datura stramonium]